MFNEIKIEISMSKQYIKYFAYFGIFCTQHPEVFMKKIGLQTILFTGIGTENSTVLYLGSRHRDDLMRGWY